MVENLVHIFLPKPPGDKVVADSECNLFPGHLFLKFPDPDSYPFDTQQRFNSIGKIACYRYLDIHGGVKAA